MRPALRPGAEIEQAGSSHCQDYCGLGGFGTGFVVGGLVGGISGYMFLVGERWEEVPLRPSVSMGPAGFRVSLGIGQGGRAR